MWLYHKIETKDLGYHGILNHFQKVTNMTQHVATLMDNTNQNSITLQVPHILIYILPCVRLVCLTLMLALMPPLFHIKLRLHITMHQY